MSLLRTLILPSVDIDISHIHIQQQTYIQQLMNEHGLELLLTMIRPESNMSMCESACDIISYISHDATYHDLFITQNIISSLITITSYHDQNINIAWDSCQVIQNMIMDEMTQQQTTSAMTTPRSSLHISCESPSIKSRLSPRRTPTATNTTTRSPSSHITSTASPTSLRSSVIHATTTMTDTTNAIVSSISMRTPAQVVRCKQHIIASHGIEHLIHVMRTHTHEDDLLVLASSALHHLCLDDATASAIAASLGGIDVTILMMARCMNQVELLETSMAAFTSLIASTDQLIPMMEKNPQVIPTILDAM